MIVKTGTKRLTVKFILCAGNQKLAFGTLLYVIYAKNWFKYPTGSTYKWLVPERKNIKNLPNMRLPGGFSPFEPSPLSPFKRVSPSMTEKCRHFFFKTKTNKQKQIICHTPGMFYPTGHWSPVTTAVSLLLVTRVETAGGFFILFALSLVNFIIVNILIGATATPTG